MKKLSVIFLAGSALMLSACSNDSNTNEPGTGDMDDDITMTAPEEPDSSNQMSKTSDSSATISGAKSTVPGSDNPRKIDIGGQPHQPGPPPDSNKRNVNR